VLGQLSTPSVQGSADNDAGAAHLARHAGKQKCTRVLHHNATIILGG
jgi:hypothetical protein